MGIKPFNMVFNKLLVLLLAMANIGVFAFAPYHSLAGLSARELEEIVPLLNARVPPPPPGAINFTGTKLVDDEAHQWKQQTLGDQRGPCPGLNTLASHGVSAMSLTFHQPSSLLTELLH